MADDPRVAEVAALLGVWAWRHAGEGRVVEALRVADSEGWAPVWRTRVAAERVLRLLMPTAGRSGLLDVHTV